MSEILKTIYSLIWNDFCSWYLEWVKPSFVQRSQELQGDDKASADRPSNNNDQSQLDPFVYQKTIEFFEQLMQLLHPFMPFVTEEIYQQLRKQETDLTIKQYPGISSTDTSILQTGQLLKDVITAIRDARIKSQLKPRDPIQLHILSEMPAAYHSIENILARQVNAESVQYTSSAIANSINLVVGKDKFFLQTTITLDTSTQKEQLQKDLDYLKGFLLSVEKKLSNERFVNNAKPEVVDVERKKKEDAEAKIRSIEESLANLES